MPFGRGLVETLLAEYSQAAALTFMAQASADYLGSLLDLQYTARAALYAVRPQALTAKMYAIANYTTHASSWLRN